MKSLYINKSQKVYLRDRDIVIEKENVTLVMDISESVGLVMILKELLSHLNEDSGG